ncbi:transporter, SSS family [Streptoalloteichus tenebrarius]|uniref:Transporter, SSS family n=1 Tax=Streptoalloteichus tenebrarius (strain ATCC 17920 / DSM 40477 / JCM 4838 / CBS 697.72 / NBRC 16177 / NCIMB 11028 / NRRL B-12390 / A12253. 1 / ISP 5477) TaxID=1933 RepID=A0ABT1HZU6_STRSD|nr:sodium:solute symporter [Streptoalloteichus tenebrarius]MCP2260885.1 transporter, SSS family [Streptoalloteichus tenebrarius]BFF03355.1 sodium:solute symporter [Streptoalloteichus tenebrarius]
MHTLDLVVIVVYLLAAPVLGIVLGGRQKSAADFFVSDRNLSWWVVCFAIVATETSTLTVISIPATAYLGSFTFLALAVGYVVGRIVVSLVLLPRYFAGELVTAYAFLGKRFGPVLQGTASATFLVTRLLADGVRLFATAIPIKVMLSAYDVRVEYWHIVLVISVVTIVYTYLGGTRAVIWVDAVQMLLYVGGALVAVAVLAGRLPDGWFGHALEAGKFQLVDTTNPLTNEYSLIIAVLGGAFLSMASHGADQLIVQRLLACRSLRDGQRALVTSGVVVFLQFALFLLIGTMLWSFYRGAAPASLGLAKPDELFPTFIIHELPQGVSGLLIAGILAAAMTSSLNSLATSTVTDIYLKFSRRRLSDAAVLRQAKVWTLIWGVVLFGFASMFTNYNDPVVKLGLSVTGYTYGALLGAFLLGLLVRRATQLDAVVAFVVTVAAMAVVILVPRFPAPGGASVPLAFPWYTPLGVAVTLLVGGLLAARHRGAPRAPEAAVAASATRSEHP